MKELSNIGLGNATTALATLIGKPINMEIPNVETMAVENVQYMFGDPEQIAIGISMPFEGDVTGHSAFLFPWESAQTLWTQLIGSCPSHPGELDELAASAMIEVGNIVSSTFLNAISDMTNLKMHATPPVVSLDLMACITSTLICQAEIGDSMALAIETRLYGLEDCDLTGFFLCIPTVDGLKQIFTNLGITEAA